MHFRNEEEYKEYAYSKSLRKTANGLGTVLLVIFALEIVLSFVIISVMKATGADKLAAVSSVLELLENGMLSSFMFFFIFLIYILIKKRSIGALFPFEKIGAKKLWMLCVIGIFVSLMSNIAPTLLTEVFGLFGLRNSGGDMDFGGLKPNILLYYLTVAIMPAFTEEFAFRGVILGSLRKYSDGLALVVSSALFALMHGNFVQIPFTFCCGLMFGFLVIKTNSLLPSIIVHFLNNGLSVTFDLLLQYQVMSIQMINLCYGAVILITGILSLLYIRKLSKDDQDFFRLKKADDGIPYRNKVKSVAGSPTLITFAVVMFLFSVYVMMLPYLIEWGVIGY